MFRIVKKRKLNKLVFLMEVEAPLIAKALAGQFIIFRADERAKGFLLLLLIIIGKMELSQLFFKLWAKALKHCQC